MKMWQVHLHNFLLNSPVFLHSFYPYGTSEYSVSGPSKKLFWKQKLSSSVPSVFWKSYFFAGLVFIFITMLLQTEGIQQLLRVTPREFSLCYKLPLQLHSAQLSWAVMQLTSGHSLRGLWLLLGRLILEITSHNKTTWVAGVGCLGKWADTPLKACSVATMDLILCGEELEWRRLATKEKNRKEHKIKFS